MTTLNMEKFKPFTMLNGLIEGEVCTLINDWSFDLGTYPTICLTLVDRETATYLQVYATFRMCDMDPAELHDKIPMGLDIDYVNEQFTVTLTDVLFTTPERKGTERFITRHIDVMYHHWDIHPVMRNFSHNTGSYPILLDNGVVLCLNDDPKVPNNPLDNLIIRIESEQFTGGRKFYTLSHVRKPFRYEPLWVQNHLRHESNYESDEEIAQRTCRRFYGPLNNIEAFSDRLKEVFMKTLRENHRSYSFYIVSPYDASVQEPFLIIPAVDTQG